MQVQVIPFGVLKDWLGPSPATVELPEGASVAELLERLRTGTSTVRMVPDLRGIAVSVNAEYAPAAQILCEGDEVGLLPPVSGGTSRGTARPAEPLEASSGESTVVVALTRERIDTEKMV